MMGTAITASWQRRKRLTGEFESLKMTSGREKQGNGRGSLGGLYAPLEHSCYLTKSPPELQGVGTATSGAHFSWSGARGFYRLRTSTLAFTSQVLDFKKKPRPPLITAVPETRGPYPEGFLIISFLRGCAASFLQAATTAHPSCWGEKKIIPKAQLLLSEELGMNGSAHMQMQLR